MKFVIKVNGDVQLSKLIEAASLDKAVQQAKIILKDYNYTYTVFEVPSYITKMNFA